MRVGSVNFKIVSRMIVAQVYLVFRFNDDTNGGITGKIPRGGGILISQKVQPIIVVAYHMGYENFRAHRRFELNKYLWSCLLICCVCT